MTLNTHGKRSFSDLCKGRTKSSPAKSNQLCLGLSNNSPNENHIDFLERLKEAPQKFTNLNLDSYEWQVILSDKFLSQCASDIRIKLQQLQQQDPPASLDKMVQTATNTSHNREQEREAKIQEREKRKETRHAQMLATFQGSSMANLESLKDKARAKCLICRQAGHWLKECPNHDKSPKMACYKCHKLEHWVALCPWDSRASNSSTKPSLMMVQQDWSGPLQPAHLSQITITGLEPRVQLDMASRSENLLVDTGATYSVLTSCSRAFSCQTCTFLGATGKTVTKDSPKHFFVAGRDKYFPTSFWWSLSVLLPYWEEITPCLQNLAAIAVLIEDSLKLSFGGKLFLPDTKWNNSWMGQATYGCLIKGSSGIKQGWWKIQASLHPLVRFLT